MRRLALATLAALLVGCGAERTGAPALPEFTAVRSTVFGAESGDGALSQVFGVAVSADGRVFVSEPQFARVVEFGADGTFTRVLGGRGDGPGEFRIPGAVTWRADSLAVLDFQSGISLFASDGTFQGRVSFAVQDGGSPLGRRPMIPLDDGSVLAFAPHGNSDITEGRVAREPWLKTDRGAVLDTLVELSVAGRLYSVRHQEIGRSGAHPLAWSPLITAPPSGTSLVVVDREPAGAAADAAYTVVRIALDGDTADVAMVPYAPRPVSSADIDSIAAAMAARWAPGVEATAPALASAIHEQIEWPAFEPPVTAVVAGDDGSVWIRREVLGAAMARWDLLRPDLHGLGWVQLPLDFDAKVVSARFAYGVELDDFDVPSVVRYDIQR